MIKNRTHELITQIRDHVNRREKQVQLLSEHEKWLKLTSSLDVLADTACAIEYYLASSYPDELGAKYLYTYGLLQCIMLMQDAANGISSTLLGENIQWEKEHPQSYQVRMIRNDVAGHPTNRKDSTYIYLAQSSLSKDHFVYMKSPSTIEQQPDFLNVDVEEVVSETFECINGILKGTVDQLDTELRLYKDEHKQRKMANIFSTLGYASEKVLLRDVVFMAGGYRDTKRMISECEQELIKRFGSVETIEAFAWKIAEIKNVYGLIEGEIDKLSSDFRKKVEDCLHQYLFDRLEELKSLCEEVDGDFEAELEPGF